jgi:hypothetical protein
MTLWRKAHLKRRLTALTREVARRAWHRAELRVKVAACGELRAALAAAGIDPAGIDCMSWFCNQAAAEYAELADTPQSREADAALLPLLAGANYAAAAHLSAEIARRVAHFADNRPPPDRNAAPLDWLAWSAAQRQQQRRRQPQRRESPAADRAVAGAGLAQPAAARPPPSPDIG